VLKFKLSCRRRRYSSIVSMTRLIAHSLRICCCCFAAEESSMHHRSSAEKKWPTLAPPNNITKLVFTFHWIESEIFLQLNTTWERLLKSWTPFHLSIAFYSLKNGYRSSIFGFCTGGKPGPDFMDRYLRLISPIRWMVYVLHQHFPVCKALVI